MELPKRARTADWESGILTLDGEKQFEVPELTAEIMEQLAGYTLVGFHVKGYPVTDELLAPFAGHKSMANCGVEDGVLTDACFPVFSAMPKLRYLLLDGNAASPDSDPEQAALAFICKRLRLNLKKLSEEEKKWLKKIAQKSDLLKNPNPQRGRK